MIAGGKAVVEKNKTRCQAVPRSIHVIKVRNRLGGYSVVTTVVRYVGAMDNRSAFPLEDSRVAKPMSDRLATSPTMSIKNFRSLSPNPTARTEAVVWQ